MSEKKKLEIDAKNLTVGMINCVLDIGIKTLQPVVAVPAFLGEGIALGGEVWKSFSVTKELSEDSYFAVFSRLRDEALDNTLRRYKLSLPKKYKNRIRNEALAWEDTKCVLLFKEHMDGSTSQDSTELLAVLQKLILNVLEDRRLDIRIGSMPADLEKMSKDITNTLVLDLFQKLIGNPEFRNLFEAEENIRLARQSSAEHSEQMAKLEKLDNNDQGLADLIRSQISHSEEQNRYLIKHIEELLSQRGGMANGQITIAELPDPNFFKKNTIRKLGSNVYVNWNTGRIAPDFSAAASDETTDIDIEDDSRLTPYQLRLLSILVQGEGAVVRWKELFWRGRMQDAWRKKYGIAPFGGDVDRSTASSSLISVEVAPLGDDADRIGAEIYQRKAQRTPTPEEMKEVVRDEVGKLLKTTPQLADIIRESLNGKGFYCKLTERNNKSLKGQKGNDIDLFTDHEGCSCDADWKRLRDKDNSEKKDENNHDVYTCREINAWFRRYYDGLCRNFEDRISNARSENEENEGRVFGRYTMAQVYINAYADEGGARDADISKADMTSGVVSRETVMPEIVAGETVTPGTATGQTMASEAMLDYLEKWYHDPVGVSGGDSVYGRVLVLHGQPGDGKTTFCKKAVYAHRMEGWLGDAPHVLLFSLNPADSGIASENGSINLSRLFYITDEDGDGYYCDLKKEGAKDQLRGALVILDGFDELSEVLPNVTGVFESFYEEVESFAQKRKCNVVITSRTMCIENELRTGDFINREKRRVAAFAPLAEEQQDAMIDRMMELEPEAHDLEDYRKEYLKPLWEINEKKNGKGHKDEEDKEDKEDEKDKRLKNFSELLKVPTLFRMIVAARFKGFGTAENVAELYGSLFHSLMHYKHEGEISARTNQKSPLGKYSERQLVEKYEEFAIRIFNYNDDTCPFSGDEAEDKGLMYLFYTKKGEGESGSGRLGFLHRLFYQYFLARYIVSAMREREKSKVEELFVNLRADKIKDPDLWKLVVQLAGIEQEKSSYKEEYVEAYNAKYNVGYNAGDPNGDIVGNGVKNESILPYHSYAERIQKSHVEQILKFLNDERSVFEAMLKEGTLERGRAGLDKEEQHRRAAAGSGRGAVRSVTRFKEAENAVFNLVSACAAVEKGYVSAEDGSVPENWNPEECDGRIAYKDYPNVCELLRRGDYSGIYLENVKLDGCYLENAMLRNARLAGASLDHAAFSGADLYGADLTGKASLKAAELHDVDLSRAVLDGAHMEGAILSYRAAETQYYKFYEKGYYNTRNYEVWLDQSTADLAQLHLGGAKLEGASLKDTKLDGAYMAGVVFDGAVLRRASLKQATLTGASFVGADLREAIFNDEPALTGSKPKYRTEMLAADFTGANLEEAWLQGANLGSAGMEGVLLSGAKLWKANMGKANLRNACLERADLRGAEFTDAELDGAYLIGAQTDEETSAGGASLRGACLDTDMKGFSKESVTAAGSLAGLESSLHVGDIVEFGRYPQSRKLEGGQYVKEPLMWRVLDVDKINGRALLLTEKLIDRKKYNDILEDITWEYSSLRRWMNGSFIKKAFTAEERSRVAWVWNENPDNEYRWRGKTIEGGNATRDRVFAMNIDEAKKHFKNDVDRRASVTRYALGKDAYQSDSCFTDDGVRTGLWWLRSPGLPSCFAAYVRYGGGVSDFGHGVYTSSVSVRPALWLNL